jgi:hypothetical protein
MEIKLFDNLKNALKDNRDELAQEEDLYGDSYYGEITMDNISDWLAVEGEGTI